MNEIHTYRLRKKRDVTSCKKLTNKGTQTKPNQTMSPPISKERKNCTVKSIIKHLNHHDLPTLVIPCFQTQPRCTVIC